MGCGGDKVEGFPAALEMWLADTASDPVRSLIPLTLQWRLLHQSSIAKCQNCWWMISRAKVPFTFVRNWRTCKVVLILWLKSWSGQRMYLSLSRKGKWGESNSLISHMQSPAAKSKPGGSSTYCSSWILELTVFTSETYPEPKEKDRRAIFLMP